MTNFTYDYIVNGIELKETRQALPNFTTLFFRLRSVRRFRVDMCIKSVKISLSTNPIKKHQQKPLKTAHFCTL